MSPSHSYSQHSAASPWLQRNCSWKEAQEMPALMAFKVKRSQHCSPPSRAPCCLSQPPQAVPRGGITSPRQEQDRSVTMIERLKQKPPVHGFCIILLMRDCSSGSDLEQGQPEQLHFLLSNFKWTKQTTTTTTSKTNKPNQPKSQLKQKKNPLPTG